MKQNVTLELFREAFKRASRQHHFSFLGVEALYDHLIEYEASSGEEIALDVIQLCSEYVEVSTIDHAITLGWDCSIDNESTSSDAAVKWLWMNCDDGAMIPFNDNQRLIISKT